MEFMHSGWGDLLAGVASILIIVCAAALQLRRMAKSPSKLTAASRDSQVQVAQDMFVRVIGERPHNQWLKSSGDTHYRIMPFEEGFLVERVEWAKWPPLSHAKVDVTSIVAQPAKDYAPRFVIEVTVTEDGEIPRTLKTRDAKLIVSGFQRGRTQAEASEIIEWMQALDEVRPEE